MKSSGKSTGCLPNSSIKPNLKTPPPGHSQSRTFEPGENKPVIRQPIRDAHTEIPDCPAGSGATPQDTTDRADGFRLSIHKKTGIGILPNPGCPVEA
jgi:hypothetical protein